MNCKLCGLESEPRESHIFPKFVFRWMRETSGGSYLRNAGNFNIRQQDGLKLYLFCDSCEKRLNVCETYFSKRIFYPYLENKAPKFSYNKKLFYFLVSILWRTLLLNLELLQKNNINHKEMFLEANNDWRNFLLAKIDFPKFDNIHLVFTDIIVSDNLPTVNYNRYTTRATDGALLYTSKSAIVYSKFSKFMVFGKLIEKPNVIWENTKVVNGESILDTRQLLVDPSIEEYIIERAAQINNMIHKETSKNQKEIIRNWGFNNLERFANSELFQTLDADYSSTLSPEVFSKHKFGRNDYCPCGSGKKYKYCHGK